MPAIARSAPRRWRRAMVTLSMILGMLLAGGSVAPSIALRTEWRNSALQGALGNDELQVTCEDANGGWITPLIFRGIELKDKNGQLSCRIKELRTGTTLSALLFSPSTMGEVELIEPNLEVHVDEAGKWPVCTPAATAGPSFPFRIQDGSLKVNVPWRDLPIVDLAQLNVSGDTGLGEDGRRRLRLSPTRLLNKAALSDLHAEQNMALVAPILSQSTEISGSASVWIDEVSIPLEGEGAMLPFPVRGRAVVHSLDARLREAWARQLSLLAGQTLGTALPDAVQVVKDTEIRFEVSETGIQHDGMTFLLPEIASGFSVESSGTIGLDEKLDLILTAHLPEIQTADKPFLAVLAQMASQPLRLNVRGTVSEPQLVLPDAFNLFGRTASGVAPAGHTDDRPTVSQAVGALIEDVTSDATASPDRNLTGSIVDLIGVIGNSSSKEANQGAEERRERNRERAKARRNERRNK